MEKAISTKGNNIGLSPGQERWEETRGIMAKYGIKQELEDIRAIITMLSSFCDKYESIDGSELECVMGGLRVLETKVSDLIQGRLCFDTLPEGNC